MLLEFFRYKGVRIQPYMRHLLLYYLLSVFILSIAVPVYLRYQFPTFFKNIVLISFVFLLIAVCALSMIRKMYTYSRIANMIYLGRYFLIDNVTVVPIFGQKHSVKKKIVYYPKVYVKATRKNIQISVLLDGSKFHQQFKEWGNPLEDMFSGDLQRKYLRNSYMIYDIRLGFDKDRVNITKTEVANYEIVLMDGLVWNIAKTPHGLIVGGTGGGKTYFLFTILLNLLKMGAKVSIYDVKRSALASLNDTLPGVFIEGNKIIQNLRETYENMIKRFDAIRARTDYMAGKDFTYYKLRPVVVIIDEFVALQQSFMKKEDKEKFGYYLRQIVLMGREAGYFLILTTQRPDASFMPGDIRDQLGIRIALGKMSSEGYSMAFGSVDKTFVNFEGEKGRGYCFLDGVTTEVRSFYSPYVPPEFDFRSEIAQYASKALEAWAQEAPDGVKSEGAELAGEASPRVKIKEIVMEEEEI
ncbi:MULTISPECIES: FtsK/SpoIIIE domain-containing protein [unclassified Listeria]|uniref:FtsK/SpoIIIE domain-containing protein n=1 Tax=unclassified Listeria TaxID=2642072 RepID=UPI000B590926|nr:MULTISPECIES: FtsK/SpoIIIE domain-containing protein [unclassified Listeria]